jgi:hypothetical protein
LIEMAEIRFLPRTFLARTAWGTEIHWDRELGLLRREEGSDRWLTIEPDTFRREFPELWWTWTRFAVLLPPEVLVARPSAGRARDDGGDGGGGGMRPRP